MDNSIDFKAIAEKVITQLNKHDLGAYLWTVAKTGSCYIRFTDSRMCSVRIGDHNGIEKYKYKFNLRSDLTKGFIDFDNGIERFYFPINDISGLIEAILERKKIVSKWKGELKFKYGIPSFKRKIK